MEIYIAIMDHKKLSGVSKAKQGPISYAFYAPGNHDTMEFTIVMSIHTVVCFNR